MVGVSIIRSGETTMIRDIAVFTFLVIVGVCSYVVLNPGSYSTLVLCPASFVLCVAILAVAPVWRVYLFPHNINNEPSQTVCRPAGKSLTPESQVDSSDRMGGQ
jgi:hypothetical protein